MISTKGRYALSVMLDIMQHDGENPVCLKDTAKRQDLSQKYLEQIAATLKISGLLGSSKGKNGGYYLLKKPEEYTVGEILRVMEGDLAPAPCASGNGLTCRRKAKCPNFRVWEKINDAVNSVVDNITLADMYEWQREQENED